MTPEEARTEIGSAIRAERMRRNLSQRKMAQLMRDKGHAHTGATAISLMEQGKQAVRAEYLVTMSHLLNVPVTMLLGGMVDADGMGRG